MHWTWSAAAAATCCWPMWTWPRSYSLPEEDVLTTGSEYLAQSLFLWGGRAVSNARLQPCGQVSSPSRGRNRPVFGELNTCTHTRMMSLRKDTLGDSTSWFIQNPSLWETPLPRLQYSLRLKVAGLRKSTWHNPGQPKSSHFSASELQGWCRPGDANGYVASTWTETRKKTNMKKELGQIKP